MRFLRRARQLLRRIRRLEIPIYAAYAAYFLVLSVFPAMMLVIGVLQYTPLRPEELRRLLERVIPVSLGGLLDYMINELFAVDSAAILSVSAAAALWMASRGIVSLHRGLNRVYSVRETRSGLRIHLRSLLFTLAGVLAMVLVLALNLLSRNVVGLLVSEGSELGGLLLRLSRLKYLITTAVLTPVFTAMYCLFPDRRGSVGSALPGGFFSAVLWVVFTQLFSLYADRFANYSIYYGSLAVMAMAMLWLYVCILILFCGGLLNYELERQSNRRSRLQGAIKR